ncbi:MAG TPA: SDR family oxidoreductase [Jiangellaceae bacterium]|nr:SDR family oxidoreductase [Jiangellaceae bacterium]
MGALWSAHQCGNPVQMGRNNGVRFAMAGLLQDKVAIVTGGTSGIGRATVERYVDEGAKVVIADIQDDKGQDVADGLGDPVLYVHTDVTNETAIEAVVKTTAEHFGKLDIIYNNAGAQGDPSAITDLSSAGFDKTVALLARSVLLGHKFAARQFKEQGSGGAIVSTASAAGLQGGWSAAGYTIAKHAVVGVVRQAVAELAPFQIRSNAIAPGIIMTPIMARSFGVPLDKAEDFASFLAERLGSTQPYGRVGFPEDIARVATFLASDLSEYVTGTVIPVDGGATAITQGTFSEDVVKAAEEYNAR